MIDDKTKNVLCDLSICIAELGKVVEKQQGHRLIKLEEAIQTLTINLLKLDKP